MLASMKMLGILFVCFFSTISADFIDVICPDDEVLQHSGCRCASSYVYCSSLPTECRTCSRYNAIFFDEQVHVLPAEAFRSYYFFSNDDKRAFQIHFAQMTNMSSNTFSKMKITQNRILNVQIDKYLSTTLPSRVFADLVIQSNAKFNIEINNVTSMLLTVEQDAFHGIRFNHQSQFRFSVLHAKDTIQFQSHAGSAILPSYSRMELDFSKFNRVVFNERSFDHIRQEDFSELIIHFDHFENAIFSHNAFVDIRLLIESRFHLLLANLHSLSIEQTLFNTIAQVKSSFIVSIYNLTNDLCLPNGTFHRLQQTHNSTFELDIQMGQNLLFASNSFTQINQTLYSTFIVSVIHSYDIYFSRHSFNHFRQEDRSLLDLRIKSGQSLIFDDYAMNDIDMDPSSILGVAFQNSRGTLQMATSTFSNIKKGHGGELRFQIMNSADFHFRFNKSTSFKQIQILDRALSSTDLCRISDIPSHIPVKLLDSNQCSCTVYYLYRSLRRKLLPSHLKQLTPTCYSNMSMDEIESSEAACSFETAIYNCQQMEGEIQINIPHSICQNSFKSISHHTRSRSKSSISFWLFITLGIFLGSVTCLYIFLSNDSRSVVWQYLPAYFDRYRRQRLPVYSADSYQQLTEIDQPDTDHQRRRVIMKYNSATDRVEPCLKSETSEAYPSDEQQEINEDLILKLNANPMSDIEDNL